ncbi:MAG: ABC transporter permease [Candidatus Eisenbacteria bacterium]|nr:ABC transporter permease [Candidatus Eisenbacteria bacterium]
MKFSISRALTIARREYRTTIRRKAFLFSVLFTPAYFAFVMWMSIKPQVDEQVRALKNFNTLGVVDSSGAFASVPDEIRSEISPDENPFQRAAPGAAAPKAPAAATLFRTRVRVLPDQAAGEAALRAGQINQLLVIPSNYLATGKLRRYALKNNLFSSAEERPVSRWLVRALLAGSVDSLRIERAARPSRGMALYTLNREGQFELKDSSRELLDFLLPFMLGMLLSMCIVTAGQYLLQGVAEEKESRILESLLCTVSAEDLMAGKLIGLGGAALTLVGCWVAMGAAFSAPAALFAQLHFTPLLIAAMLAYLLLGFLFYASLMTGIGAITNNIREAQQFAFMFTFANFVPFIMMRAILGRPDGSLAVGLSMFPPTAQTTMMLRLSAPGSAVPGWQIALSLTLLAVTAVFTLKIAARVFRVGLLMYGKTPNLPEILRWARQG